MNNQEVFSAGFLLYSSWANFREHQFSGMAFTDRAVIVGSDGYDKYLLENNDFDILKINEGRFSVIHKKNDEVFARTDCMGQDLIFYYCSPNGFAISNSFIWLARHLKENNISLSIDFDVLHLWRINHSITQGLISSDTYFNEIKLLPRDSILKITKTFDGFKKSFLSIDLNLINDENLIDKDVYGSLVRSGVSKMASRSFSLISYYKDRVKVDITGGVDSRLVLGIIASSGLNLSEINFQSNEKWKSDFEVANNLSNKLGFQIKNKNIPVVRSSSEAAFDLWKIGCAGVYSPIYIPLGSVPQSHLHFHGACGECFRDFYKSNLVRMSLNIDNISPGKKYSLAFSRKMGKSIHELNESVYSNQGLISHYVNYRSRFHFGRSSYKNLNNIIVSPLASPDFLEATKCLSLEEIQQSQLALDILLLTRSELAELPFDDPSKAFKKSAFERSIFSKGKRNIDLYEMKVYCGELGSSNNLYKNTKPFSEILVDDVLDKSDSVISTGIFTKKDINESIDLVKNGNRLTLDGIRAAHIISIGEVVSIAL